MVERESRGGRRRTVFQSLGLALMLLGTVPIWAASETDDLKKPAWKWTTDERLAARFDPQAMAAREAEHAAQQEALRQHWERLGGDPLADAEAKGATLSATETIDGSKTPELLLPMELFTTLIDRGFPTDVDGVSLRELRSKLEQRAAALGFGRDLWDRLEKAAAPYLTRLRGEDRRRLSTGAQDYKSTADRLLICRARAQALETAKGEFGEEAFLRLLYEGVAPDVRRTYVLGQWPPDYQQYEEELRFQAKGGCR